MSLLTLGVETSGFSGTLALRRDGQSLASVLLELSGRRHAQTLVSEAQSLLRSADLTVPQIDVVAVSIGPGSFTGLRVGVVFAKTLAYAIGCRLVAVDTLRAIAAASPGDTSEVFVVSDAQRGDLFVGHFQCDTSPASPIRLGEIVIQSAEEFFRRAVERSGSVAGLAISGPAAASLPAGFPANVRTLTAEFRCPQAMTVAQLGEQDAMAGNVSDPWRLEPFYLRRSAAEEKSGS